MARPYLSKWEKDPQLSSWLTRDPEDENCAYCKLCRLSFDPPLRLSTLKRHATHSKEHLKIVDGLDRERLASRRVSQEDVTNDESYHVIPCKSEDVPENSDNIRDESISRCREGENCEPSQTFQLRNGSDDVAPSFATEALSESTCDSRLNHTLESTARSRIRDEWIEEFGWIRFTEDGKIVCASCEYTELSAYRSVIVQHELSIKHKINSGKEDATIRLNFDQARADIRMAALIVDKNLSFLLLESLMPTLKGSYPDSPILESQKLGRLRAEKIVVNVIAPCYLEKKAEILRKNVFSLGIDEYTDCSMKKILCLVTWHWDEEKGRVVETLWELVDILDGDEHQKADSDTILRKILELFEKYKIPLRNLIAFIADNCSVMMGVCKSVAVGLKVVNPGVKIIGCPCHLENLCARDALSAFPDIFETIPNLVYNYIHGSGNRSDRWKVLQKKSLIGELQALPPSDTRWLAYFQCMLRIDGRFPALRVFFKEEITPKTKQSSEEKSLLDYFNKPVNRLYHRFLVDIYSRLFIVNKSMQSSRPTILEEDYIVRKLYINLLSMYLKPSYMNHTPIGEVDPSNKINFRSPHKIIIRNDLKQLIQRASLNAQDKMNFLTNCRTFLSTLCQTFKNRFNFNSNTMLDLRFLHPNNALSRQFRVEQCPDLNSIFEQVPLLERTDGEVSENQQYREVANNQWTALARHQFPDDITQEKCADIFWKKIRELSDCDGHRPFEQVGQFALNALCIPNSNTGSERVWSRLGMQKNPFRNRLRFGVERGIMLSAQCIHDSGGSKNFEPTQEMYLRMALNLNDEIVDKRTIEDFTRYGNTQMTDEYLAECEESENFRRDMNKRMKLNDEFFKHNDDNYVSDSSTACDEEDELDLDQVPISLEQDAQINRCNSSINFEGSQEIASADLNDNYCSSMISLQPAENTFDQSQMSRSSSVLSFHPSATTSNLSEQVPLFDATQQSLGSIRARARRRRLALPPVECYTLLPNGLIDNHRYYMTRLLYRRPIDSIDSEHHYKVAMLQITNAPALSVSSEDYRSLAPFEWVTGATRAKKN